MGSGGSDPKNTRIPNPNYQSIEMKLCNAVKPHAQKAREFLNAFIPLTYETVASFLRIPTFIRKEKNNQTIRHGGLNTDLNYYGCLSGFILGAATGLIGTGYALHEASRGNYLPLAVIAGCNLASGINELGRLSGKRDENPENYKSVEQIVCNAIKPHAQKAGEFLKEFTPWTFGGLINPLRLPSMFRKLRDGQSYIARATSQNMTPSKVVGRVAGLIAGGAAMAGTCLYAIEQAILNGNYTPLAVIAGCNVASGLFEIGRGELFGNSKQNQKGTA